MALRHVDPTRPHSALDRGLTAVGRSRAGRWFGINISSRIDPFLLRHTGGRVRTVGVLPTVLLESRGARTGQVHQSPVLYFHDGADVIVVASSFGRDKHPGWYHNLVAHPDAVRLNGEPYAAAEVVDPAEKQRLFALAVLVYPGFTDYQERTAAIGRRIPVMRLTAS